MEFDNNKPIYIQIADNICERVLSGEFKPGDRIPSVREWGARIGVNPNTVARSYEVLSNRSVISNQRGNRLLCGRRCTGCHPEFGEEKIHGGGSSGI